jgi:hypothetical protein
LEEWESKVKISRAMHLMHLEGGRFAHYREAKTFLNGNDLRNELPFPPITKKRTKRKKYVHRDI